MSGPDRRSEPVSYAAIKVDCNGGLVVEVLHDSVDVNVTKPHSTPGGFVPDSVKRPFKINKDVIEVPLVDVGGTSHTRS